MQKFSDSLPGRILTVILAVLTASALAYLIFLANRGILPNVLRWSLVLAVGLTAGFAVRFFLPGRALALRLLTVFLAILIGLMFLALVSRGAFVPQPDLTLLQLAPLGLAFTAALLALSALKHKIRSGQGQKTHLKTGKDAAPAPSRQPATRMKSPRASNPASTSSKKASGKPSANLRSLGWAKRWERFRKELRGWWEHGLSNLSTPQEPPAPKRKAKSAVHVRMKRSPDLASSKAKTRLGVRLVGKEEHRCPYCLEEVAKNDPRGITICPICHTHHHSDCWAVTGTCQVPHSHE